ncbi:MAG: hypothetical protein AYK19_06625 [Theionarchaea archaeon DG-70-1]|nr:MAG: hypothetical protein AYK19_06625 [Theionarchaea archaeon DG-70-1]
MREKEIRSWRAPEFWLVVVMLLVLTALVFIVLWMPFDSSETGVSTMPTPEKLKTEDLETEDLLKYNEDLLEYNKSIFEYNKDLLEYRKTILTVIVTAFGAWVGAGAAYFFSRENVRETAESMLKMREPTPREILLKTPIREIPPREIRWTVKVTDTLEGVLEKLKAVPTYWFIPVVDDKGRLDTVIEEEAVWRFVDKESENKTPYEEIKKKKISDMLAYLDMEKKLKKKVIDKFVSVTMDESAGHANELMQKKDCSVAIVVNEKGKPTHFLTTGDVREVLLRVG